ncbi:hypothetical protein ACOMHN_037943 [Nucella lapillus]
MRLMRYRYSMQCTRGQNQTTVDALSRALAVQPDAEDRELEEDTNVMVNQVISNVEALHPWIKPYWSARYDISFQDSLLLHGTPIIIPVKLHHDIPNKLLTGHQGIVKTCASARESEKGVSVVGREGVG